MSDYRLPFTTELRGPRRDSPGARANSNGQTAEAVIEGVLARKGVSFDRQAAIGDGIFGTPLRADFRIRETVRFPQGLIIESKGQQVAGSAEEKLPYLVENIRRRYPCPTVVVIDGGGHRDGAIAWLRAQADGYRLIHVFTLQEFIAWTNQLQ